MIYGKWLFFVIFSAISLNSSAKLTGSLTEEAINERLQPVGQVKVSGNTEDPAQKKAGQLEGPAKIFDSNCKMCHKTGLAGAPKINVKSDWQDRLKQGIDVLTTKAYNGFKAMPPKGNCLSCSKEDIRSTIEYMTKDLK